MESLLETIDLDIEESNDLAFKIRLEGISNPSPAKIRLVCEGKDVSYMFNGYGTSEPETVQFTLPQMNNKLQEGIYNAKVEVLIENRYFAPLQFQINFKKTVKVFAEAIKVAKPALTPEIKISAVSVQKSQQPQVTPIQKKQPAQSTQKKIAESKVVDDPDSVRALIRDVLFSSKTSK